MSAAEWKAGRFEIDADTAEEVFTGLYPADDHRWNGWAVPMFAREVAEAIVSMVTRDGEEYRSFAWDGDVLIQTESDGDEKYVERIEPILVDGVAYYSVGAYSWTWTHFDADAPEDAMGLDAYLEERREKSRLYCDTWNKALRAAYAEGADAPGAYAAAQAAVDAAGLS